MPGSLSARRRRSIDQFWIDRFQAVWPSQLIEVNLLLGHFFGLCPTAEAAEVVVINFVERERTYVGVPLLARRFLAEIELGLGIGPDGVEVLLRDVAPLHRHPQPADCRVLALRTRKPFRACPCHQLPLHSPRRIPHLLPFVSPHLPPTH